MLNCLPKVDLRHRGKRVRQARFTLKRPFSCLAHHSTPSLKKSRTLSCHTGIDGMINKRFLEQDVALGVIESSCSLNVKTA